MAPELTPKSMTPDKLVFAAVTGDWDMIDSVIALVANETDYLKLAKANLADENGDLRDLAVSIYEATSSPLTGDTLETFTDLMTTDGNPYVRFRSAFALFRHGDRS